MASIIMKQLLEAGAHFGHRTQKWNPKMAAYIHSERNGIHVIDLAKTIQSLKEACQFIYDLALDGKTIMFVGTKKQASQSVYEEATAINVPFVCERWLGGMLTNHQTIKKSIDKLANIEAMEEDGTIHLRPKREVLKLRKLASRLKRNLEGIQNMKSLPSVLIVVDIDKESIAIKEAHTLGIPVIGLVDTNCNPDHVDICIPCNDDAIKSTKLILNLIAQAYEQGYKIYAEKVALEQAKIDEEKAKKEELELKKRQEREEKERLKKEREASKEKAAEIARKNREAEKLKKQEEEKKIENPSNEQKNEETENKEGGE